MPHRFNLAPDQLLDMAQDFAIGVGLGLAQDGQEIKALITYVTPCATPEREALVVDLGGTSVRAARVAVGPTPRILSGPAVSDLPVVRGVPLSRTNFLAVQTELLGQVCSTRPLPLGYCFSYPARSLDDGDAILLNWTKEVFVPDTEGHRVGQMLARAACAAGVPVSTPTVVNDTVAALLAGLAGESVDGYIGVIVGTGTNMAVHLPSSAIPKFPSGLSWPTRLPVNLESGNYSPPCLNAVDDAVDMASKNPGDQRLEKAVSGAYLGRLLAAAAPGSTFDGESGSAGVVAQAGGGPLAPLASAILNRSADLVAASLAGLVTIHPAQAQIIRVVAEGGLFWGAAGYVKRVRKTLGRLLPLLERSGLAIEIVARENANLIGTALATTAES
jgi:hexokinase